MAITAACPKCGKKSRFKDEAAGRRLKCPKCQQAVDVPEPDLSPLTAIVTDPEDVAQLDPAGPDVPAPQSPAPAPAPAATAPAEPPLSPFEKRLLAQLDQIGGIALSIRYRLAWVIFLLLLQLAGCYTIVTR